MIDPQEIAHELRDKVQQVLRRMRVPNARAAAFERMLSATEDEEYNVRHQGALLNNHGDGYQPIEHFPQGDRAKRRDGDWRRSLQQHAERAKRRLGSDDD